MSASNPHPAKQNLFAHREASLQNGQPQNKDAIVLKMAPWPAPGKLIKKHFLDWIPLRHITPYHAIEIWNNPYPCKSSPAEMNGFDLHIPQRASKSRSGAHIV